MDKFIAKAKEFIKRSGFVSVGHAAAFIALWILGYPIFAGVAFGWFLCRNWAIIEKLYKEKIEDLIEEKLK